MAWTVDRIRILAIGVVFVVAALALVAAQDAVSGGGRRGFGPPMGRGQFGPPPGGLALERLDRELEFTDAQRTQIQSLLTDQRTALQTTMASLAQAEHALAQAVLQTPADESVVQSRVADLSAIQGQLALARALTESKIYQLLTPEQQQKVQQIVAQMAQRHEQRGGRP